MKICRSYESSHRSPLSSELADRGHLVRLVVVGGETELHASFRDACIFLCISLEEVGCRNVWASLRIEDTSYGLEVVPRIVHFKSGIEVVLSLAFSEKEKLLVRNRAERVAALLPEIEWNEVGSIATETVHAYFYSPELHCVDHCETHFRIVEVEVCHVSPVLDRRHDFAVFVCIPLRMLLNPPVVPRCVVCNPVYDHAHASVVTACNYVLELLKSSELRVYTLVIADAVWRVHGLDLSYRVDRHEPYYVGTQSLDGIKVLSYRIE